MGRQWGLRWVLWLAVVFLAGMALVTTLFAASLWDWVPIALPSGISSATGSVRGSSRLVDAFLMGAFANAGKKAEGAEFLS